MTFPGPRWTADQIAAGLVRHQFTGWQVVTMGAICPAESGGHIWAHGLNLHDEQSAAHLTEDHGLFQVNEYWGALVLSRKLLDPTLLLAAGNKTGLSFGQCAKDPEWNLAAAREMFLLGVLQRGYTAAYTIWNSYVNGLHRPFLGEARRAAERAGVKL